MLGQLVPEIVEAILLLYFDHFEGAESYAVGVDGLGFDGVTGRPLAGVAFALAEWGGSVILRLIFVRCSINECSLELSECFLGTFVCNAESTRLYRHDFVAEFELLLEDEQIGMLPLRVEFDVLRALVIVLFIFILLLACAPSPYRARHFHLLVLIRPILNGFHR